MLKQNIPVTLSCGWVRVCKSEGMKPFHPRMRRKTVLRRYVMIIMVKNHLLKTFTVNLDVTATGRWLFQGGNITMGAIVLHEKHGHWGDCYRWKIWKGEKNMLPGENPLRRGNSGFIAGTLLRWFSPVDNNCEGRHLRWKNSFIDERQRWRGKIIYGLFRKRSYESCKVMRMDDRTMLKKKGT